METKNSHTSPCFVNVIMLQKFTIDITCTWMEETRNDNIILAVYALKSG